MITERKRGEIFVHQSGAICVRCWPRRRSYSFGDQILPMWQIYEATNHSTAFRTVWTAQIWSFPFWFGPRSYVILNQVQVWSFEQSYLNSWDFYVTERFTESLVARRWQTWPSLPWQPECFGWNLILWSRSRPLLRPQVAAGCLSTSSHWNLISATFKKQSDLSNKTKLSTKTCSANMAFTLSDLHWRHRPSGSSTCAVKVK